MEGVPVVSVDNLIDYTVILTELVSYLKLCFYALVIIIVLHIIKGA